MLGAIVIIGPEVPEDRSRILEDEHPAKTSIDLEVPPACIELLGRSVLERTVDQYRGVGVEAIEVLADRSFVPAVAEIDESVSDCPPSWVDDAWSVIPRILERYKEYGIQATFIFRAGAYVEMDLQDFLQFHRYQNQAVTRALAQQELLDIWVVDTMRTESKDVLASLGAAQAPQYSVSGYVNHLNEPRDLRRLVVDSLSSVCGLRPLGFQARPGVWLGEGAEIDRRARIVAPAFVGRGSTIGEQSLITRCSSVESYCQVDYGTVVEDSSILSNSYVGIGLDISHSIVSGSTLFNLERDVSLNIADRTMIRPRTVVHKDSKRQSQGVSG